MRRRLFQSLFISITVFASYPLIAQENTAMPSSSTLNQCTPAYSGSGGSSNSSQLVGYLLALGQYLGYDLAICPETVTQQPVSQSLLSDTTAPAFLTDLVKAYLGALIPTSPMIDLQQNNNATASSSSPIFPNTTFSSYTNATASTAQAQQVTINSLIDQTSAPQNEPISQYIVNNLITPHDTYCYTADGQNLVPNCPYISQDQIISNVLGSYPNPGQEPNSTSYLSPAYNDPITNDLNANSLIPFHTLSTTPTAATTTTTTTSPSSAPQSGLYSANPLQQAVNFIHYATEAVVPSDRPALPNYDTMYQKASNPNNNYTVMEQLAARDAIAQNLVKQRVYLARQSVGVGAIWEMLSRRIPQKENDPKSSQAYFEYKMGTRRLFNEDKDASHQWIQEINTASSATVQKEIALLLAEISYQLYLNRQMQERALLTESILLLQNNKASSPGSTLDTQPQS